MRHRKQTAKLGRKGEHRNMMLANLVCSLILHRRVKTTLAKAKAARSLAEKMVTFAKKGTIHHRRLAVARLHQEDAVRILFKEIAPFYKDRPGGYTRIIKLGQRRGDAAPMAILEWVEEPYVPSTSTTAPQGEESPVTASSKEEGSEKEAPSAEASQSSESKTESTESESATNQESNVDSSPAQEEEQGEKKE